jgi:hypothetical protein
MKDTLTHREAYLAMYAYLLQVFARTQSDDLGALLGDMSTLPDGETADPVAWQDWLRAVDQATSGAVETDLRLE